MNGPVKQMLGIIPPEVTWRTCKLSSVIFDLCDTDATLQAQEQEQEELNLWVLEAARFSFRF